MLGINMNDVLTTLGLLQNHLIAIGICLVLAIIVTIAAVKIKKPARGLVRGTAWVAFILALVLVVNLILTGPMYSMVSMVFKKTGDISEESIKTAYRVVFGTKEAPDISEEELKELLADDTRP